MTAEKICICSKYKIGKEVNSRKVGKIENWLEKHGKEISRNQKLRTWRIKCLACSAIWLLKLINKEIPFGEQLVYVRKK